MCMSTVRVSSAGSPFHTFQYSQTRESERPRCRSNVTNSRCSILVSVTDRPCTDVRSLGRVSSVIGPAVIVVKVASLKCLRV